MKLVLNKDFGGYGYGVTEEFEELVEAFEDDRTNEELIKFVEANPSKCGDLKVIELPEEITDHYIEKCDGYEKVIYVVKGKLYFL